MSNSSAANEGTIANCYATLVAALQTLDDLGEDLTLVQYFAMNPQYISGRTHMIARIDGEWRSKKEDRKD